MKAEPITLAHQICREIQVQDGIHVTATDIGGMLSPESDDMIEIDVSNATAAEKAYIQEQTRNGWNLDESSDTHWILTSNYYPLSPQEMLQTHQRPVES